MKSSMKSTSYDFSLKHTTVMCTQPVEPSAPTPWNHCAFGCLRATHMRYLPSANTAG